MATDWNKTLVDAVKEGDEETVKQSIANEADVNLKWGHSERTPLHYAAANGNGNLCRLLLDAGANADEVDDADRLPLHFASEGDYDVIARLLIARNAESVDKKDEDEMTPLHLASKNGSLKVTQILVDANAKVDECDFFGGTSLHYAAEGGFKDVCKILIDAGASVDEKDTPTRDDRTPLHYASEGGHDEICKMLLDAGAKVDEKRVWAAYTPLHMASQKGLLSTCLLLIRRGADIHSMTSHGIGKTPLDLIRAENLKELLRSEFERIENHRQLLEYGHRKLDIVKLFLFGYPEAGKTTLHNTLTKMEGTSSHKDDYTYKMTPGIDVGKYTIGNAGQFHTWDCAGHIEFHVTHGMFLGAGNSIFLAVYDISKESDGSKRHSTDRYWLSFIKSLHPATDKKVKVIMVATHLDQVKDRDRAQIVAQRILKHAQATYAEFLDIHDSVVVVDGRVNDARGMVTLRETLKELGEDIKGNQEVPNVCDQLQQAISSWKNKGKRVLKWKQFLEHVKEVEPRMDEDFLKKIVRYLHDMGEIYLAEMHKKTAHVVLDTQWFSYDIIGSAFAGDEFLTHFQKLPEKPYYSKEELKEFFEGQIDVDQVISLLEHVDLLHDCEHDRYLLPGKLPATMPKVYRSRKPSAAIKGRRIECVDKTDMFNPNVFPCIQKILLDEFDEEHESTRISRSAVTFTWKNVEGMVQLTKNKNAINIAVQTSDKSPNRACECHQLLERVVGLIEIQLIKKSPGTAINICFISPASMMSHDDLHDVWTYSKDDITRGEEGEGLVIHRTTGTKEKVTNILCPGFDMMFLEENGSSCRYQWLPYEEARRCFKTLDKINTWREDYRSVAEALKLKEYDVTEIVEETSKGESLTINMIEKWCERESRKMTIAMLDLLLDRLSLTVNQDAKKAIDEVLDKYRKPEPKELADEPMFDVGITVYIATWRLRLKHHWTKLKTDLEPDKLVPYLESLLPSDMFAELEEASTVQRRHQNTERLLQFFLESNLETWPEIFVDGLRQTKQFPAIDLLKKEDVDFPGVSREPSREGQERYSKKRKAEEIQD